MQIYQVVLNTQVNEVSRMEESCGYYNSLELAQEELKRLHEMMDVQVFVESRAEGYCSLLNTTRFDCGFTHISTDEDVWHVYQIMPLHLNTV